MKLEEIIDAAVEKRVSELVENAVKKSEWSADSPSRVEQIVEGMISKIAQEEVKKHERLIRSTIIAALSQDQSLIELSAYSRIRLTKGQD